MVTSATRSRSFLDTVWARLIALVIAVGGLWLFYSYNREVVDPIIKASARPEMTPYQECLDERIAAVGRMAEEAGFTMKQRELAEIRAAETCRDQTGG